ncbi:hypothetical protein HN51_047228 [Arachis hypogaea]
MPLDNNPDSHPAVLFSPSPFLVAPLSLRHPPWHGSTQHVVVLSQQHAIVLHGSTKAAATNRRPRSASLSIVLPALIQSVCISKSSRMEPESGSYLFTSLKLI